MQGDQPHPNSVKLSAGLKDADTGQRPLTASVSGSVVAPDSAAIVGARVVILDQSKKQRRLTTTDEQGKFQFTSLPPDVYFLEVAADGFSVFTVSDLLLKEGDDLRVDARMRIGPIICEVIEVHGNAGNGGGNIGVIDIVKRKSFWDRLYEVVSFPYTQGKKVFSR
jgi:Carboxypeptidase regulatory-like domain